MPTNSIDPNSVLEKALDGLALRQRVIANNVANVDTPNFKASDVRFEDALQRALSQPASDQVALARTDARHLGPSTTLDTAPQVTQMTDTTLRNDGNNVDIEQQMALLSETTLKFSAVSEALARRFAILRMVASDGR